MTHARTAPLPRLDTVAVRLRSARVAGHRHGAFAAALLGMAIPSLPAAAASVAVETLANAVGNGSMVQHPATLDLYVGDFGNLSLLDGIVVSVIDPAGNVADLGVPLGRANDGNAFDSRYNFYEAAYASGTVWKVGPDGTASVFARVPGPIGLEFDSQGVLYVSSCTSNRIFAVQPDGSARVLAAGGAMNCPNGLTMDGEGNLVTCNWGDGRLLKIDPQGTVSLLATVPNSGSGHIEYDPLREVFYVAGRTQHVLYEVTASGEVRLLAGSGAEGNLDGPPAQASFSRPNGIAVSRDGRHVYSSGSVAQRGGPNAIRRVRLDDPGIAVETALSGAWFAPETAGQGLMVDVLPSENAVFVAWFTFTRTLPPEPPVAGTQRWYSGLGRYQGSLVELELFATDAGALDSPTPAPTTASVGRASLRFLDCHHARFEYAFDDGGFGAIALSRPAYGRSCRGEAGASAAP